MLNIDKYAYNSRLRQQDPKQKLFFALLTLGVCLWANGILISLAVLLIMGWMTVRRGGTPLVSFLKLLLVPMTFLAPGVMTVVLEVATVPSSLPVFVPVGGVYWGVSPQGLFQGATLFCKALGAVSCLYFLILTTPLVDILSTLGRLRCPSLLSELMALIYRFIFVLMETAHTVFTAQNSRLGYSGLAAGYRSLGMLASSLFFRAYRRSDELYTALEARGYQGELKVLEERSPHHWRGFLMPVAVNVLLVAATLGLKGYTGGWF